MATSPEPAPRSPTPGKGAVPVFVRIPRRAGRLRWNSSDAAHGALLGLFAPVIAVPFLLPGIVMPGGWALWTLLWYLAWLALVAVFAVGFERSGERAGLVTLLVLSCVIAVPSASAVTWAVASIIGR